LCEILTPEGIAVASDLHEYFLEGEQTQIAQIAQIVACATKGHTTGRGGEINAAGRAAGRPRRRPEHTVGQGLTSARPRPGSSATVRTLSVLKVDAGHWPS